MGIFNRFKHRQEKKKKEISEIEQETRELYLLIGDAIAQKIGDRMFYCPSCQGAYRQSNGRCACGTQIIEGSAYTIDDNI